MGQLTQTTTEVQSAIDQQYDGDGAVNAGYDDVQGSVGSSQLGATAPTWRDYAYGIGGGVTFRALGMAVNDILYLTVQTSHGVKLNTILDEHIHFTPASDSTGKRAQFQMDVIAAGVDGTWAVPTGSPFTAEAIMATDLSGKHTVLEIGEVPASNTTVSTLYKLKLTRIAATQDEFAGEIFVEYMDGHMLRDQERGSRQEYIK